MDSFLIQYLDKALKFEEQGNIDEAILLYGKLLETFPDRSSDILIEKAKLEFRNMRDKEALLDFIRAYALDKNEELYDLVLEAYLRPNLEALQERYWENIDILRKYPFYSNDFDMEELDIYVLWIDTEVLCIVNVTEKSFGILPYQVHGELERKENSIMLINQLWLENILYYKDRTKRAVPLFDAEIPYYLVYDRNYWMLFAQSVNLEELIGEQRVVFLIGEKSFHTYFEDLYAITPQIIGEHGAHSNYVNLLNSICEQKAQMLKECKRENTKYYQEHSQEIIRNIQNGKPRILFWTSRFTSILQYHTRNSMQAAQRIGCETELLIEPDGIHRIFELACCKCIREFKPDMIFCIDHFRFEHFTDLDEIIWITWIQDPLPWIMNTNVPKKLGVRDIVLNHMVTSKEFYEIGYDKECLIDAPIPADSYTYKTYELNSHDKGKYSCDICFVCHSSDVNAYIEKDIQRYPKELQEPMCNIYRGYQKFVYETGTVFYTEAEFQLFVDGALKQHFGIRLRTDALKNIAKEMLLWFNQRVYRHALVDWLIDAGFNNIKLWGSGWMKEAKYAEYAMGDAENGEILSKIYQSSKIVVGNNVSCTNAARAWESMLSGTFYLGNYVPPEIDTSDIRRIIKADDELVMFYDKEDLVKKVGYYLTHEEERQRMIEIGREVALREMTFDSLMRKTIQEIPRKIEQLKERREK